MTNPDFTTIDLSDLCSVSGGAAKPSPEGDDAPRTWKEVGKDYTQACITGAGEALMFGGKPRNAKTAALTAATGCAMGIGMKALEDGTNLVMGR